MAHIHTKPGQYDFTASAFIVRNDFAERKIVLHLHKKLHKFQQFGGHIELHETPWQAVEHELLEESGYTFSQLKLLQPKQRLALEDIHNLQPVPMYVRSHKFGELDHYHTDISFAFITNQKPLHQPANGESTELRCFSLKEVKEEADIHPEIRKISTQLLKLNLADWDQLSLR